ncbi:hypothetical protein IWZ03DRAFT_342785 [Phyllosticta citriasiana]|uniref:Uncharacterized protein n=1 Tax=Phyllosticta citriasiana TaxID=595635 RepID=A0ABR1KW16_9PEZI
MDPPPTDRALVEARSPHIDLPTINFQSINKVPSQARSFSTVSTTQLPSTVHAGAAATNSSSVLVTRLERLGHGKGKVKSEGIGRPKLRTSKPNPKNIINGGDPQHREFECTYGNPCKLGQYTKDLSRKMVSDYFGRNKKATAMIEGKWIVSCRKHYQRLSYQESWPSMKANIVRSQLAEIEAIEPGMPWQIKLKNSEEKRLTRYLHACAQSGTVPDWTAPASVCVPDDKKQSSLAVLHSLSAFCGANKTRKDCDDAITAATAALSAGRATHFPLFEMIPQFSALGKRKRSDSPASEEERPDKAKGGRPRKKSRSEDEQDGFVEVDDHDEDDSEDEDFVMENAESDSEGS